MRTLIDNGSTSIAFLEEMERRNPDDKFRLKRPDGSVEDMNEIEVIVHISTMMDEATHGWFQVAPTLKLSK